MSGFARGAAVRSTLDFLRAEIGATAHRRALAALDRACCARLEAAAPGDEVPFADLVALWRAADDVCRAEHPDWMERAGAYSIALRGAQLYGGILRKASPREFLTQSVSLFQLFYHPGDMEVVEERVGYAVLRLVGFDPMDRLFCRRLTGGLRESLRIAGGERPVVTHVRCAGEGDAFCEWELRWETPRATPAAGTAGVGARPE